MIRDATSPANQENRRPGAFWYWENDKEKISSAQMQMPWEMKVEIGVQMTILIETRYEENTEIHDTTGIEAIINMQTILLSEIPLR